VSEKLEVLDLIINTLREHERELSEIATRLDEITQLLRDTIFEFIGGEVEGAISTPETPQPMSEYPNEEKMTETRTEEAEEREEIIPPETSQPRTTPLGKESMTETKYNEVGGQEETEEGFDRDEHGLYKDPLLRWAQIRAWKTFLRILDEIRQEKG